jgi:hypothetical protein
MAYWVDAQGNLREGEEELGRRYGYREATEDDLRAHNERLSTEEADTKGTLGLIGEGFTRGLGHIQEIAHQTGITPPTAGGEAFGPGGGLPMDVPEAPAPPSGATTFPESMGEDARLRAKAHPVLTGIGTGLAAAPFAGIASAAGGAIAPVGILGGTVGGIGAEAIVEAVAQEYDDAWLEQRPYELKNVAAYTAMFGLGDVLLRGGGAAVKRGVGAVGEALGELAGGRNIVAEAQARSEKAGRLRPAQSIGAASARDMAEPFDEALSTMTDRDAMVLARDADDHYHLVARDAADELTRIHRGLTESLGNHLKYEDFKIGADAWSNKVLERQSEWLEDVAAQGQEVVNRIRGDVLDYGNAGKLVAKDIETYSDLIMNEAEGAQRNYLVDQLKKRLDKRIMDIAADFRGDPHARKELLKIIEPYAGSATERGMLRDGLENPKYWGHNADLQKALNAPWHDLLTHWRKFQEKLYEASGEVKFAEMGAGRTVMESTAERVLSVLQKDTRVLQDLGQHVAGTFDGYQRLIEARQSKGIVGQGALPDLDGSIRNLMEDWNLGATLSVAKARAENAAKNPRNWHLKALDLAEKAPFGVGTAVGAARAAGRLAGDLHIKPGTPLSDVWDAGLKRYAQNPTLADTAINQAYSDWMQAALRQRGAPIPDRRTPWGGIKDAAKEHGGKVAGGLFGLGAEAALSRGGEDGTALEAGGMGGIAGAMLFGRSGKQTLLAALKNLRAVVRHRGIEPAGSWKVAQEMFPEAKYTQTFLGNALDILERRGIDLDGPNAEREVERALGDALPEGMLAERLAKVKKETTKLAGASTKAERATPRIQAARDVLGPAFTDKLGGKYTDDWTLFTWAGAPDKTFGSYGEPFEQVIKRRLAHPAPLSFDEYRNRILGQNATKFTQLPREERQAAAAAWGNLRNKIEQATAGLDDQFRKVDAEDNVIREALRDALGMRPPPTKKKPLDAGVDATSRYRKAKKGYDAWRKAALPDNEYKATQTWQTHYYRSINADARMGAAGVQKVREEQLTEGWLNADQVKDIAGRATRIGAELLAALNKSVAAGRTVPGRVRRGISMPEEEVGRLLTAKTVTSQGFMSTSIHSTTPEGFAARRAKEHKEIPVMLEIEQQTGVPLGQGEGELTLRPGTTFDVLNVERTPDGVVAYLRESESSTLTPERFLEGIAGTIPTEAKIAGGLLALGATLAPDEARAAPPPDAPDAPDLGPSASPSVRYREALRSVANGAPLLIQRSATAALRRNPSAGRDPLRVFIGRRGLDAAVDSAREAIATLQGDPAALIEQLGGSTGDLARTHPSLYMALVEKAAGIVAYLSANVPTRTGQTLLDPEGMPPSRDRSVDFIYKVVGAAMPRQAMADIARLDAPPEEVASFQANWGELWEGMRLELLGQIQRRYEAGRPVDSERLRKLDGLLGMNGQLDPSASVEVAQHIIASAETAAAAPGAGNSGPTGAPSPTGRASGMLKTRLAGLQMESTSG